jgi:type II secretory pathway pseudopilin PulG
MTKGFSLVELAMVLALTGLLLGGLLMPLNATIESARRKEAKAQLESIKEALFGFAMVHGRLPCPATPASGGEESFAVGDAVTGGQCTVPCGLVPAVTLGIGGSVNGDGLLLDPWMNPYRYAVSEANHPTLGNTGPAMPDFTYVGEMQAVGIGSLTPSLHVCDQASDSSTSCSGAADPIAKEVPVVIYSLGSYWARSPGPNEKENAEVILGGGPLGLGYAVSSDRVFVSAQVAEAGEDAFNDLVVWVSSHILYSKMVAAGRLP